MTGPPTTPLPASIRNTIAHLSAALQFKTLARDNPAELDAGAFIGFQSFLRTSYPRMHDTLAREEFGQYSLLYSWTGADASLDPILLLAHQDVVPAEDEASWLHPPFSGEVADGAVWGRGAIDVKGSLIAICEAVEELIGSGFRPRRTIHIAFGHDEETGGLNGAARIGELLAARGVRPLLISDEGGAITSGILPGIGKPVALVGIAEKGYLSLKLKVSGMGGHASMPPPQTAIGILSRAIARLETNPFPARIAGVTRQMLEHLRDELSPLARLALRGGALAEPLIRRKFDRTPGSAAALRTTTAVTMIRGGVKDNILPQEALAVANFRTLPGDGSEAVIDRVTRIIGDDRVRVSVFGRLRTEASPVADVRSEGYRIVRETIGRIAPDAVVAPYLVMGGTDSRHYTRLTPSVFRFSAIRLTSDDLSSIHGSNERLTFENCGLQVRYYSRLMQNAAG